MSLTRSVKYYMREVFFSVNDTGSVDEKVLLTGVKAMTFHLIGFKFHGSLIWCFS